MKRRITIPAVAVLVLLLLSLLSGCGKADEGPDDKPIALEPAGSVISMLTFTVPEDMAPGTTFTFAEEELLILGKDYNMLPNCRYTSGTLTVTE